MDRIRALRAFVHVADGATFAAAARALRVRQPTVSKWIAGLEAEAGVGLVARSTRTRHLTDAGRRFAIHARQLVDAYDAALRDVRADATALRGRLSVALPVVFGERFLLPLLTRFFALHPNVEAVLSFSDRYVDPIRERVDVAFRVGRPVDSALKARTLAQSRRCLVAAPALAEALAIAHPLDLAHAPCLVHSGRVARENWHFERAGAVHAVSVQGRVVANHSVALLQSACAGTGVALLADWLVADALKAGDLVALLPEYAAPPAPVQAITPPHHIPDPTAQALIAFVQQHLPARLPSAAT